VNHRQIRHHVRRRLPTRRQNGTRESFNGRFRDEFLTTEQFGSMLEVLALWLSVVPGER